MFLKVVRQRDTKTLIRLMLKHVTPGSHIISDGWRAYREIDRIEFYTHDVVIHNVSFINERGEHTNTIEGNWLGVKRNVPLRCKTLNLISPFLSEFIWRRLNNENFWDSLISLLKQ